MYFGTVLILLGGQENAPAVREEHRHQASYVYLVDYVDNNLLSQYSNYTAPFYRDKESTEGGGEKEMVRETHARPVRARRGQVEQCFPASEAMSEQALFAGVPDAYTQVSDE